MTALPRRAAVALLALALVIGSRAALAADASWTRLKAVDGGDAKDQVSVTGVIHQAKLLPEGASLAFRCGTFSQVIPAANLKRTAKTISFKAPRGAAGIRSFSMSRATGKFSLSAARIETGSLDGFVPFSIEIGGKGLATLHDLSEPGVWKRGGEMRAVLSVQVFEVTHERGNVQVAPAAGLRFPGGTGSTDVAVIGAGPRTTGVDGRVSAVISLTDASALDSVDLSAVFGSPADMAGSVFSRVTAGDDGEATGARFVEPRTGQSFTLDPALSATLDAPGGNGAPAGTLSVPAGAVSAPLAGVTFTPLSLGATLPAPVPETYVYVAGAEIAASAATEFVTGNLPSMSLSRPTWVERAALQVVDLKLLRFTDGTWVEQTGRAAYDADADRIVPFGDDPAKLAATGVYAYAAVVSTPAAAPDVANSEPKDKKKGKPKPKPKTKRAIRGRVTSQTGEPLRGQVVFSRSGAAVTGRDGIYEVPPSALGDGSVEIVQAVGDGLALAAVIAGGDAVADAVEVRSTRDEQPVLKLHALAGRASAAGGVEPSPAATISFTSSSALRGMIFDDAGTPENTADDSLTIPDLSDVGVSSFRWTLTLPGDQPEFLSSVTGPVIVPLLAITEAQDAGRTITGGVASLRVAYDVPVLGEIVLHAGFRLVAGVGLEIADLQLPAAVSATARKSVVATSEGTYVTSFFGLTGMPVVAEAVKSDGSSNDALPIRLQLLPGGAPQIVDFAFEELAAPPTPSGLAFGPNRRAAMPAAAMNRAAVPLGGLAYVLGGRDASGPSAALDVFDPLADSWTAKEPMSVAREFATAVALDGVIYAIGGTSGTTALATAERYDPVTDGWTAVASMGTARLAALSAVVDGRIYVFGGLPNATTFVNPSLHTSCEIYDPSTNRWTSGPTMPVGTWGIGNALFRDGSVFVRTVTGSGFFPVLDLSTDTWSLTTSEPAATGTPFTGVTEMFGELRTVGNATFADQRIFDPVDRVWGGYDLGGFVERDRTACAAVNGILYAFGGFTTTGDAFNAAGLMTETVAVRPIWTPRAPLPEARESCAATTLNGHAFVAGGTLDGVTKATLFDFDPKRNLWRTRSPMGVARERFGLVAMGGKLYAVGGAQRPAGTALASAEVYDPVTGAWTDIAPMSTARAGLVLGAIGGKLYACGGGDATVEEYDPATNSWTARTPMPGTRTDSQSVVVGNELLVFSGTDGSQDLLTVISYRPATNAWTVRATEAEVSHREAALGSALGDIFMTGGADDAITGCTMFDPVLNIRDMSRPEPGLSTGRRRHSAVTIDGTIYVIGGVSSADPGSPARRSVDAHKPE